MDRPTLPATVVELRPSRSLSPLATRLMTYSAGTAALTLAAGFAMTGAWPASVFLVAIPGALTIAFRANNKTGKARQEIAITRDFVTATHVFPNGMRKTLCQLPTAFTFVDVKGDKDSPTLHLRTRGQSFEIGQFLPPKEKPDLAGHLRAKIKDAQKPDMPA